MTADLLVVLGILAAAVVLFLSGRVRLDLVALLVVVALALSGILTPAEALSGFGSPAVVTVWAVFILSAGLSRTGVAGALGKRILRLGGGEARLTLVIMLVAAALSAFMNNVGVAAFMLPVVMDVARSAGIPPARLLLPLAYACLLGGLTTLIGTPPNILVADALRERGAAGFGVFDFTPVGGIVALGGIIFLASFGRRLLPARDPALDAAATHGTGRGVDGRAVDDEAADLEEAYELREQLFTLRVEPDSALDGRLLAESHLGETLGLNVLAVVRHGETRLAPDPGERLRAGDRLLVQGRPERLAALRGRRALSLAEESLAVERLAATGVELAEARLEADCPLLDRTLADLRFRERFGLDVLAVLRDGTVRRVALAELPLEAGDRLLVQGSAARVAAFRAEPGVRVAPPDHAELYGLTERLLLVRVPPGSSLAGRTLTESRLGEAFGLGVLGIVRDGEARAVASAEERLREGDLLMVAGAREAVEAIAGLRALPPEEGRSAKLESERVGLVEAVLAPRSSLAGRTLRELSFRERHGLSVLSLLRQGEVLREGLADLPLRFGDALLLYGPAERLRLLRDEPELLVLTRDAQRAPRREKAPLAALILVGALAPVLLGWVPIAIAAVAGAAVMVLAGCLTMEEAYRDIDWRAVFLIAGMLPLGLAMERTGAAVLLAEGVILTAGAHGPMAVMAAVFLITALGAQLIPPVAMVVLMAPIVLTAATGLGISSQSLMMTLAMAASASFMSPIAHPANVLVMGPGGYRFSDYLRVGLPTTLVVFAIVMLVVPVLWPL